MAAASRTPTPDTQLFNDVFNASPIGIAVENLEGQPLFVNPSFCSFLGFSEEELRNKHCVDFSPPEDAEKDWALFQQLRAGSIGHYQLEKRYFRRDGSLVWGSLSISLLKSSPSPLVLAMVEDLTDKKRAEEALFRHAAIVESSDDAIISKNLDGVIVSWNGGAQRIYGYTEGEAVGKPMTILVPRELVDEEGKILERVRAGERIEHYETVRVTKEGREINVSLSVSPIKDSSGRILGLCSISRDISDRKRGEEARRLTEQEFAKTNERLQLAMEAGAAGGWDYDLKTGKDVWFGAAHAQLGMTRDETLGSPKEFWDRVHGDDRERLEHALQVAKEKHEDFGEDVRVVWRDGTTNWLRSRGRFHYAANGEAERSIGISLDITERKRAEEALLRYAAIVESSEDAIASGTLDGIIVSWNTGAQHLYGYTEAEAVGKPITMILPPELRDEENKILETVRAGGHISQFETVRVAKTGKRIDVSLTISPIKDSSGRMVGVSGIARDITERKRAEEPLAEMNRTLVAQAASLQAREELLRVFVKNVPAAVAMLDRDMRYLQVSDRWCSDNSVEASELLGRSRELSPEMPDRWKEGNRRALQGETLRADEDRWESGGSTRWARWEVRPWRAADGTVGGILIFAEDITRMKEAEETLSDLTRKLLNAQEQERARIGRELHDDIGQRLALLAVELQRLHEDSVILPEVRSLMNEFQRQPSSIAADIQSWSHELHSAKMQYLGIAGAMRGFCREFGEQQKLEIDFHAHDLLSPLSPDTSLCFFRVLQEALHNAVKHSGVRHFEVRLWGTSDEIHLTIKDSGAGFDRKAAKASRGLGLISMEERLKLVNGTLSIDSQPKRGTTLHARVPLNSGSDSMSAAG